MKKLIPSTSSRTHQRVNLSIMRMMRRMKMSTLTKIQTLKALL